MQILKNAVGCGECAFVRDCGGLPSDISIWGCYSECLVKCKTETCDLTCPNNQHLFANRIAEIGGTYTISAPKLNVPSFDLPTYIPKIHNGSSRVAALRVPVVAVSARALLKKTDNALTCRFEKIHEVHRHFRISGRAKCVISCISTDDEVEDMWAGLKYGQLAKEFARLKPAAVIVPNFSFFVDDVPRTHIIYNRKRIAIAARVLSDAGCPVILPLNALTQHDWDFWYSLLQENPDMRYVAKEFQTGLSDPVAARHAIEQLAQLQDRLGRCLHPVAFAGGPFRNTLRSHFNSYTIIESRAFVLSAKRQRVIRLPSGRYRETSSPTAINEPIDELLDWNVRARSEYLDT